VPPPKAIRVKLSAAQICESAKSAASTTIATRYQFSARVKIIIKTPNRLGPSSPSNMTIARWKLLTVAVWAMPEKFGKTVSSINRPPVKTAPKPWPNSCAQVERNIIGIRAIGTCRTIQTIKHKPQNWVAGRHGGRGLIFLNLDVVIKSM